MGIIRPGKHTKNHGKYDDLLETYGKYGDLWEIHSGKHTKNYGKSPCLMGKSTINGHFQ